MKAEVHYSGTRSYGPKSPSQDFETTIEFNPTQECINVKFNYLYPPKGQSKSSKTNETVRSVTLEFTELEALQFATSLLTLLHHPTKKHDKVGWVPPKSMRRLSEDHWKNKIEIERQNSWIRPAEYSFENNTDFHIGSITMKLVLNSATTSDFVEYKFKHIIDLRPGKSATLVFEEFKKISAFMHDKGLKEVSSIEILEVTGYKPK